MRFIIVAVFLLFVVTSSSTPIEPTLDPPIDLHTRINVASASNGAKVLAASRDSKKPSAILEEDLNSYWLAPCSTEARFVLIELTSDVYADTLVLEDHELHSSRPRDFELYGRKSRPIGGEGGDVSLLAAEGGTDPDHLDLSEWTPLGNYSAPLVHSTPLYFTIPSPKWIRYLLVRFISHHGDEVSCCLTSLRIYGKDEQEVLEEQLTLADQEIEALRSETEVAAPVVQPHDDSILDAIFFSPLFSTSPPAPTTSTPTIPPMDAPVSLPTSDENVFIRLVKRVKDVEMRNLVLERAVANLTARGSQTLHDLSLTIEVHRLQAEVMALKQKMYGMMGLVIVVLAASRSHLSSWTLLLLTLTTSVSLVQLLRPIMPHYPRIQLPGG